MSDSWLDKLREDSENYKSPIWDNMSEKRRIRAMDNTIKSLSKIATSSKLHVRFDGEVLEFEPITRKEARVKLKCNKIMNDDTIGFFDSKTNSISVNRWMICANDGMRVFENLIHEFGHKMDCELTRRQCNYPTGSKHYACLNILKHNLRAGARLHAFGLDCGKRLYVDNTRMTNITSLNTKKSMLYMLISTERHANSLSQSWCEQFFDGYSSTKYMEAFHDFRQTYHCMHFSNAQIAAVLDRAQSCIINEEKPTNAFDAIVAYDIATTVALNNGTISPEKYAQMQKDEARTKAMAELGYEIPWKFAGTLGAQTKADNMVCDLEYLRQLSSEEQLANPELIFQIARTEWDATLRAVKDVDALKAWYYSEANSVPIGVQGDLGVYLGSDFSPQTRELKMHEMGLDIPEDARKNVGMWPYIKVTDQEMSFFDPTCGDGEHDWLIERQ